MTLPFSQIPANIQVPGSYTEINDVRAPGSLTAMPLECLILGQTKNPQAAGILHRNISAGDAVNIYGAGSIMAQAVATFCAEQPALLVSTLAVAQVETGAAASGTLAFSGTATLAGTGAVYLGGYRISYPVSTGATAAQAAQALVDACNASALTAQTGLTVSQNDSTITVTAGEKGSVTNGIDIRISHAIADIVPGILITVTAMGGGTGTPDIAPALAATGNIWITDIALLQSDTAAISAAVRFAHERGKAMIAQDCRIWLGVNATQGQALALQEQFVTAEELVILPFQRPLCSPWNLTASLCAVGAQSLNADPARSLETLELSTLSGLGPTGIDQFDFPVRNVLLQNGLSTALVAADGTIALERIVTTRTIGPRDGQPSGVWDVMLPAIAARVRFEWNLTRKQRWPRYKLASDDSPLAEVNGVVTLKIMRATWAAQCLIYQNQMGWIDGVEDTTPRAVFERDPENRNRVNACLVIRAMGSLMQIASILNMET